MSFCFWLLFSCIQKVLKQISRKLLWGLLWKFLIMCFTWFPICDWFPQGGRRCYRGRTRRSWSLLRIVVSLIFFWWLRKCPKLKSRNILINILRCRKLYGFCLFLFYRMRGRWHCIHRKQTQPDAMSVNRFLFVRRGCRLDWIWIFSLSYFFVLLWQSWSRSVWWHWYIENVLHLGFAIAERVVFNAGPDSDDDGELLPLLSFHL